MKTFRIHRYLFQGLLLATLWTYSTAVAVPTDLKGDHAGFLFDVVPDKANTENKNGVVEIEGPNLKKIQALQLITKNLEDLTKKDPTKAQQFVGALTVAEEAQIPQIVARAFDKTGAEEQKQISAAILAQLKAGGGDLEKTKFFKESLIKQATKVSTPAASSSQTPDKPGAGNKPSQTNPDGTPKTPEQIAEEDRKAKEEAARLRALEEFQFRQALAQQAALQQQQAQQAQNAKNGGGGGSGSGGSGGGGGGGSGGGIGGSNDLPQGQSIGDKLQPHNDKTPSLSQLRNNFPDFSQNSRGASDEKKKEESPFKVGGDSKKSSESDYSSKLKTKKEMDDKAKALTDAVQDPAAGLPQGGPGGNVKGMLLQGKSNVPQSLPNQWSGGGMNATMDASFGGGGDGGFGGAKVGGGGKGGGGGGGEGGFGMDVGKSEGFTPEPAIKKITQDLISGGAGSGDGGEGDEVDGGGGNNNYTTDRAMKDGSGLLVNQLVLTRDNPKVKGRGIMAYTGIISQMCTGSEGKGMAVCEKTAGDTARLSTKK